MERYLKFEFTKDPYTITITDMLGEEGEEIFHKYYESPIDWISAINYITHTSEKEIRKELEKRACRNANEEEE